LLRQCYTSRCISGQKVSGRSTTRTTSIGRTPIRGSNTYRGELHWECFCKQSSRVVNPAHKFSVTSYPLAYSLIVLPLTVARWLQFSNHKVPSAATFFGDTMFSLSGAINVLLFLIIRPGLLLFPRPEELAGPEIALAPQGTGTSSGVFSDMAKFQHSSDPTSAALDEGCRSGAT